MPILRDWTDSRTVDALDAHAERFFTRLLMVTDDYGRFHADDRILNSRLFPLKRDIRDTDIARWKAACLRAGLLRCYVDAKGRAILEIFKFGQRKKFMKSSFDPPDGQQNFLIPPRNNEVEGKRRMEHPPAEKKAGIVKLFSERPSCRREPWQLINDEKNLRRRLRQEQESNKPDAQLIEGLRGLLKQTREEMKTK
jgi:hypothetical protein